jgi:hypothetical protein
LLRSDRRSALVVVAVLVGLASLLLAPAVAGAATFSNTSSIALRDPITGVSPTCSSGNCATAGTYPSAISVTGLTGTISSVSLSLNNVSYAFSNDIDALLVGPGGQSLIVVAGLGPNTGSTAASNSTLTISDSGTLPSDTTAWGAAPDFKPVNFGSYGLGNSVNSFNEDYISPAPAAPWGDPGQDGAHATLANTFNGLSANGTWNLYVITTSGGDGTGAIAGGWTLNITTAASAAATNTGLASDNNPSFTTTPGNNVNLTATVTSTSTVNEGNVEFTDGGAAISGCSSQPVSNGTATCATTFTSQGDHDLEALYTDAGPNFGSSNGTLTQQVNNHTTVTGSNYCNTGSIALENPPSTLADAQPYPSRVFLSALTGTISHVAVTLNGVTYAQSQDIDGLLVGPGGQTLILVANAGPNTAGAISNVTLTLDDNAAATLSSSAIWGAPNSTVTSKPVNYGGFNETFGPPAPAGPYGNPGPSGGGTATLGSVFNGINPNGTWSLYLITTAAGDGTGSVSGGWCANVQTTGATGTNTAIQSDNNPSFTAAPGNAVNFTATVSNATDSSAVSEGTVDFESNGQPISGCGAVAVSAGTATCATSFTVQGTDTIEALYSGDSNFGASNASLSQAVDHHTTQTGNSFCNTGAIALNNPPVTLADATPYPSRIFVSGLPGSLTHLSVSVKGVSYSQSQDIDGLLVGPGGQTLILVAAAGPNTSGAISNVTLTLDDNAAATLSSSAIWGAPNSTVTSKPVNYGGFNQTFGPPAPGGPYGNPGPSGGGTDTLGSVFNTVSPDGTWSLYLITTAAGDGTGSAAGGWCINTAISKATPDVSGVANPSSITLGSSLGDTATVQGPSPNGATDISPSGTVTFHVYGPGDATCANTPAFTDTETLSAGTTGPVTATMASFTPTAPGTYYVTATYNGDGNYNGATSTTCADPNETVTVNQATPAIVTTASSTVALGGNISDSATLSGGVNPTGSITYNVYGPNDPTCTSAAAFTSTVTVNGNGTYSSGNFTPTAPGTYNFVAGYGGDTNNAATSGACGDASESVTVTKATPTLATAASSTVALGSNISDSATLSAGQSPTGTITFNVYGPNDPTCASAPAFTTMATVNGNGTYDSGPITPTATGNYNFVASYGGDSNNNTATSACGAANESVTVSKASPAISSQASSATVVGGSFSDAATLTLGATPTGTITFDLYGPSDPTCASAPVGTDTATASGDGIYSSKNFTATAPGTYHFVVSYGGDGNNNTATGACGDSGESVVVGKASPGITTQASSATVVGGIMVDTATLTGGAAPTGSITFDVYGPNDPTCSNAPAFTSNTIVAGDGTYTSANFAPAAPGTYLMVAAYGGDTNNNPIASSCGDANESVTVSKATPTVVTAASAGVTIGGQISDSATLAGGQATPSGTITFSAYGPGDPTCTNTPAFSATVPVNSGNGTYGSGNFTPTTAGTYLFTASYSGDTNNHTATSPCGATGESVTVAKASPTMATTASAGVAAGNTVSDQATVAAGYSPGGTIIYRLYGPADPTCAGAPAFTSAPVNVSGNGNYTSGPFTAMKAGTYSWVATYSGDANNNGTTDACGGTGESVIVTQATPAVTTVAVAAVVLGAGTVGDAATIAGGAAPGGTVTFSVYGPSNSNCTGTPAFTSSAVAVSGNGTYNSPAFTPKAAGNYFWIASYSGDANNVAVATHCSDSNETSVVGAGASATTLSSSSNPAVVGTSVTFTAAITGESGPTGTVTFSDGSTVLATESLVNGMATLSTSALAFGNHSITAAYSGDANNQPSTSAALSQAISAPGAPVPTIVTPKDGAVYRYGQKVHAQWGCADVANAPGIQSCTGTIPSGARIDTKHPGTYQFKVTAVSKDGLTAIATSTYRVLPNNDFTILKVNVGSDGTVTGTLSFPGPPGPGKVDFLVTAWNNNVAHAASLLPPANGRFVVERAALTVKKPGKYTVTIPPSPQCRQLFSHPAYPIVLRFWASYTPTGGVQHNIGVYGLRP